MSLKCDNCNKPATVHLTEIKNGKKFEKHLCEQCAAQSDLQGKTQEGLVCDHCGTTWSEFRQSGLLGCEHDYVAFEKEMTPLLQRAHEGAGHHVGKVPTRRGGTGVPVKKAFDLSKIRKELGRAVESEDY